MNEHISVLKDEAINSLNIKSTGVYLDLTLGRAGHACEILKRLTTGKLIAFDLDNEALIKSKPSLDKIGSNYTLIHDNFKNFNKYIDIKVDGILLDLGVSSPQFDDPERGFSYRYNAALDMRMNLSAKLDAKYIVNNYSLDDLNRIFKEYGEEKDAYKIAKAIIKARDVKEINTTFELVDIIKSVKSYRSLNKKGHPGKQVFQALRIEVNDELNNLKETLNKAINYLNKDARLVVITFHSLEDRIVKQLFNSLTKVEGNRIDDYALPNKSNLEFELVNTKVIIPSEIELNNNHRAKSAKLRAIRKR